MRKRKWWGLLAALLLGFGTSYASSTPQIFLMAVNDSVVDIMKMTGGSIPMVVDSVLYVPYTMLSSAVTGVDLGVNAKYSASQRTVMVTGGQLGIYFDPTTNTAYDINGDLLDIRAIVRNSVVYLPIDWICNYFTTITYSVIRTEYGTLVRVRNNAAWLSDASFVDAAEGLLKNNARRYLEYINPQTNPTQAATPRPTRTPAPETSEPTPSVVPTDPPGTGATLSLAFRMGPLADRIAGILEDMKQRALFLFTPQELSQNDALVRRLAATGHWFGLVLEGETAEACLDQAEEGRQILAAAAKCTVLTVTTDHLTPEKKTALEEAGYVLWTPDLTSAGFQSTVSLVRELQEDVVNRVEIACDANGLTLMLSAQSVLDANRNELVSATAARLAELPPVVEEPAPEPEPLSSNAPETVG